MQMIQRSLTLKLLNVVRFTPQIPNNIHCQITGAVGRPVLQLTRYCLLEQETADAGYSGVWFATRTGCNVLKQTSMNR